MNSKIGKNTKRKSYAFRKIFRHEQRLLWRHECKLKRRIPRDVAEILRGADLGGNAAEVFEDAVRLFCSLQQVKFHKRLVMRALLIWLAWEMQDRVKNVLDKREHLC